MYCSSVHPTGDYAQTVGKHRVVGALGECVTPNPMFALVEADRVNGISIITHTLARRRLLRSCANHYDEAWERLLGDFQADQAGKTVSYSPDFVFALGTLITQCNRNTTDQKA